MTTTKDIMSGTYDAEADAMYIRVKKGKVHKTHEVSPSVIVDVDKGGHILGIELLDVSSQIPQKSIIQSIRMGIPVASVSAHQIIKSV
ncbi:MAG: DUF2283 domain-containing protein [bacterium]|nr:DUF2283 domain-containing protein [bacterium]